MGLLTKWIFGESKNPDEIKLSKKELGDRLAVFGLEVMNDEEGLVVGFAPGKSIFDNIAPIGGEEDDFANFWMRYGYNKEGQGEGGRSERYKEYEFMRDDSPEVSLFLETMLSEALSYRIDGESLTKLKAKDMNGKEIREDTKYMNQRIKEMFFNNKEILESMILYGNKVYTLSEDEGKKKLVIGKSISDPRKFKITSHEDYPNVPLKYTITSSSKSKEYLAFQVLDFKAVTNDRRFTPYGRSYFESSRAPYKKLMILETLLALARSSKVDKLVVSFPVGQATTASDLFTKASRIRGMLKNLVYGAGTDVKTQGKPYSFTDVLLAPKNDAGEGVSYERLPSGVDLATIEDVEYFWDKFIASTRMPRAFFKPDEMYQGFRKLALQDLRFARHVASLLADYTSTLILLGKLILVAEKDRDPSSFMVEGEHKNVAPISSEQLSSISQGLDLVSVFVNTVRDATGLETIPMKNVKAMVGQFTQLPDEVIALMFRGLKPVAPLPPEGEELPPEGDEGDEGDEEEFESSVDIKVFQESLKSVKELIDSGDAEILNRDLGGTKTIYEDETDANFICEKYLLWDKARKGKKERKEE